MKLKNGILTAVVLSGLMSSAAGAVKWSRPDLVEKVAKGKISEANVSWWGFDKDDSTAYIQAALNSTGHFTTELQVLCLVISRLKSLLMAVSHATFQNMTLLTE